MANTRISKTANQSKQQNRNIKETIASPGRSLDADTRSFMDQRFAYDFSKVRIHTDASANKSAEAINARAYTLGNNVVFGSGEYSPNTGQGKSLLAHELAHVIQQQDSPTSIAENVGIATPHHDSERVAEATSQRVLQDNSSGYKSSALALRNRLRGSCFTRPTIQRQVETWGGTFDTDKYEVTKDPGMDGVDIELKFTPNEKVNAELIGMTQTARTLVNGNPINTKLFGKAAAKTLKSRTIPAGEAGAGTRVDQASDQGNPLYATTKESPGDTLADTPTDAFWGKHGMHYKDKAGKLHKDFALLKDRPQVPSRFKRSSQTFETTALAVKGVQEGMYYGSVQWGWEKDTPGKVNKLPLQLISAYSPTRTFMKAAELWNKSKTAKTKTSKSAETIDLPIVENSVVLYSNPVDALIDLTMGVPIPRGSTVRVLDDSDFMVHQVEVLDGPMTGRIGYIANVGAYHELQREKTK